jgi:hypothetical protein
MLRIEGESGHPEAPAIMKGWKAMELNAQPTLNSLFLYDVFLSAQGPPRNEQSYDF